MDKGIKAFHYGKSFIFTFKKQICAKNIKFLKKFKKSGKKVVKLFIIIGSYLDKEHAYGECRN
ncbi:hypothetical protein HMPREF0534_0751 [Limosilactobacillus reuteri CF48-3A]|uniref:Uncharacterized protein n=1 Tax=Limosilactobacillus reuteri CF48-3A TaxID=525341 RepID=A0A8D9S2V7_LIMRT|nr:hypothetical protein HMPREF0534_0751 [Limosilactobacillus reuteri CF48-3A]